MVGVSSKAMRGVAVDGSIPCITKVNQENSSWVILKSRVRFISESNPILGCRGDSRILPIGVPTRLIYVFVLPFKSIWEFTWGWRLWLLVGIAFNPYELWR